MTATTTGLRHDPHKSVPRSSWPRPPRLLGEYCTDLSFMLGSLSIVMFWMFGFGILLGAGAIAAGIAAYRHPAVEGNEPKGLEALLGILTGAFGIAAGLVFLAAALPNL
ncbi:hypothetical protein [Rhodococcus opacus]|uniref:hypothetical protein n=1 Tax=Rhodococcus opacus TaxID=37919 RepID=UPI00155A68DE|nr:hypothetical protein [Rhodococcus opacus]